MPVDRRSPLGPAPEASLATEDLRWLQALARRLARDPAEADDLVQETWLAAERSPTVPTRSRRAWLGGVLRNRERMLRRSEARRRRREAEAQIQVEAQATAELEQHRQRVLATLHEILDELEDDDRTLLLSRYCEEHHAPELAERLGLPASTVRSRLSRATARVRQRLDERWGGDRQAWAPAVLAVPATAPVGGPALTRWKRGSMTAVGMKIAIAAVAVSTAVGTWGLATGRFGGRGDEAPPASTSTTSDAEAERVARLAELRAQHEQSPLDRTPAALDGRVVAADGGEPLAGALVIVKRLGGSGPRLSPRALTGTDGSFRVEGLPAGRYTVTAAAFGHLPARLDGLELAPGQQRHELRLSVTTGGNALEGTITDIGGGPVEGALVQAFDRAPTEAERVAYGAITDAEGHYRMMLPDGRWTLEAGGDDYSPAHKNVQLARGPGHADFVLVPGAEIHGRVVERGTDRPVAGATVGFSRRARHGKSRSFDTSGPRETVVTDDRGRFVLRPLEPAEYALHAAAPGLASLAAPRVHAAIGETVTDVVVPVDPAFDASGFVVDAGDPTRGLGDVEIVAMIPGHDDSQRYVVTEPDGYFELHGLLPGTHMIMLGGGGLLGSGFDQQVRIEAADRDDLLIALERGTSVRGHVEPPTAGTVQVKSRQESGGVEVMLAAMKLSQATATIAPDGSFDIGTVPQGEWKLAVEGVDGSKGELEIAVSEADLEDVVVSVSPRPHVSGVVLDEAGKPLAGLSVRLEGEPDPSRPPGPFSGAPARGTAVTAADGSFVVYGLDPERLTLVIEDGRGQPVRLLDATRATVVVSERDIDGLELRVALPQGRIAGLVRGPDGEPLADAMVMVAAASDGKGSRTRSEHTPTITDADGRFVLEGLADRSYDLYAHGPDADVQGSLQAVTPGADVTLELEQLAVLQGVVTREGVPVPRFEVEACEIGGRQTVFSPDGSFTFERLGAGPCTVLVTTDDGAATATVELARGGTGRVALEIGAWGSVEGVLVSASDGKPLAGVQVVMKGKNGQRKADDRMIAALMGRNGNATDAQGRFSIDGIGPGQSKLELRIGPVTGRGQALGHHAFAIEPGQALDLGTIVVLAPLDVPETERGSLGMQVKLSPVAGGTTADAPEARSAELTWIEPGGPAERAGLRVGDRVVGFDGLDEAKLGAPTLVDAFQPSRIQTGREYALQLVRDGSPLEVTIAATPAKG